MDDDQLSLDCSLAEHGNKDDTSSRSLLCHRGGSSAQKRSNGRSDSLDKHRRSSLKDSAAATANCESIHLGVKCYRALLNNQVTFELQP